MYWPPADIAVSVLNTHSLLYNEMGYVVFVWHWLFGSSPPWFPVATLALAQC